MHEKREKKRKKGGGGGVWSVYIVVQKNKKGCHLWWNVLRFPLAEYLIFSTFKRDIVSQIHCVLEGAVVDFQVRRRWRLVIKDVKEITSQSLPEYKAQSSGRPKMAVWRNANSSWEYFRHGPAVHLPKICYSWTWKKRVWDYKGEPSHLSQESETFEKNRANLDLEWWHLLSSSDYGVPGVTPSALHARWSFGVGLMVWWNDFQCSFHQNHIKPSSRSHMSFMLVNRELSYYWIEVETFEIEDCCEWLNCRSSSHGFHRGRWAKSGNKDFTQFLIWKYLNRWDAGRSNMWVQTTDFF